MSNAASKTFRLNYNSANKVEPWQRFTPDFEKSYALFPACTCREPDNRGNVFLYSLLERFSWCFINLNNFKVVWTFAATKSPQIVNLVFVTVHINVTSCSSALIHVTLHFSQPGQCCSPARYAPREPTAAMSMYTKWHFVCVLLTAKTTISLWQRVSQSFPTRIAMLTPQTRANSVAFGSSAGNGGEEASSQGIFLHLGLGEFHCRSIRLFSLKDREVNVSPSVLNLQMHSFKG